MTTINYIQKYKVSRTYEIISFENPMELDLRKKGIKINELGTRELLAEIQKMILESEKQTDKQNYMVGQEIMKLLITKTNFQNLKNPIGSYRKLLAKFFQRKNLDQIYKYCRQVGLHKNLI